MGDVKILRRSTRDAQCLRGTNACEFGLANSIDCRNENELLIGEMTNWRVQKVSLK